MKKTKVLKARKLQLVRQTMRDLTPAELQPVNGGTSYTLTTIVSYGRACTNSN